MGSVVVPLLARCHLGPGKHCPLCGHRTVRIPTPWYFRPFRILLGRRTSTRYCQHCAWWGLGFHR